LGPGPVDGDRAHGARGHAPAFRALRARVRRVRGVALERRHPDDRLRRLILAGLHVGARQLAPETPGAPLGDDLENSAHRFSLVAVLRSAREYSTGDSPTWGAPSAPPIPPRRVSRIGEA